MEKNSKGRKSGVKDAIKAGVRPKKTTTKKEAALREIRAASGEAAATAVAEKESPVQKAIKAVRSAKNKPASTKVEDTIAALPEHKQKVYIRANAVGDTRTVSVDIKTITATSQTVYVADIHAQNPNILTTVYWIIMPNTQQVVLRVTKEEYDELLKKKEAKSMKHLYSVVDNAVFPSLTYGSWKLSEIKDFPTLDQIDEYDAKFRTMDVYIHNQPSVGSIKENVKEDDDEFEIDFSFDDEGDDDEGDEEFDFEED